MENYKKVMVCKYCGQEWLKDTTLSTLLARNNTMGSANVSISGVCQSCLQILEKNNSTTDKPINQNINNNKNK